MEWVLWIFLALVMSPVALMIISPLVKSRRESARELFAAQQAAARAEERRRAADAKAEAARAEAAQKKAVTAARKAEQERRKAEREEEQRRRQAERIAAARELAELKERQLKAEKELRALQASKPAEDPAPAAAPDPAAPMQSAPTAPVPAPAPDPVKAPAANAPKLFPQTFAGEAVAFTGTMPTMTRAEAIRATKDRGGSAYERINTHCTLLVIGERAGSQQRERARSWNISVITWEEWFQRAEISWRRRAVAQSMLKESRTQQRPVIIS